jgi:metal-responsive CopG/Arc/MetJ family transcriptional regulator
VNVDQELRDEFTAFCEEYHYRSMSEVITRAMRYLMKMTRLADGTIDKNGFPVLPPTATPHEQPATPCLIR